MAGNQVRQVFAALQEYRDHCGAYPTIEQGLTALCENPGNPKWSGPYVAANFLTDPWGNPLHYKNEGDAVEVWSLGPDGESGTDDDIAPPKPMDASPGERAVPPRE